MKDKMEHNSGQIQQRMNHFKDVFKRTGVKLTHQRIEIFHEVARTGDHPNAETIYKGVRERVPTVSLDTVYRTLWLLIDLGLITTLGSSRERVRFDANINSHHHFICTQCASVMDFDNPDFDKLKVPAAVSTLGCVETKHVEFRGLCSRCAEQGNRK